MANRALTSHQLLDVLAYQIGTLRKTDPALLARVRDDLAEAETLLGPAAEYVEELAGKLAKDGRESPRGTRPVPAPPRGWQHPTPRGIPAGNRR